MANGYLAHFGIKGQRWGIRRYQNPDGTLTEAGKKRYSDGYEEDLSYKNAKQMRRLKVSDYPAKTIKKGTKFYRSGMETDPETGAMYVTRYDYDRDMYRGAMIDNLKAYRGASKDAKLVEKEFTSKEDIKLPSLQEQIDISKKLLKKEDIAIETGKIYVDNRIRRMSSGNVDDINAVGDALMKLPKSFKKKDLNEIREEVSKKLGREVDGETFLDAMHRNSGYEAVKSSFDKKENSYMYEVNAFQWSLGKSQKNKQAIMNELKKRGYNAMYDNASIGIGTRETIEAYEPLIVFDAKKTFDKTNTVPITDKSAKKASKRFYANYNAANVEYSNSLSKYGNLGYKNIEETNKVF